MFIEQVMVAEVIALLKNYTNAYSSRDRGSHRPTEPRTPAD